MTRQQTKKVLFGAVWIGVLAWPLMGWYQTARLAGFVLAAGIIWIALGKAFGSGGLGSGTRRVHALIKEIKIPRRTLVWAVFAFVLIGPLFLNNYSLDILTLAGIYIVLALGLNIVVGMAGLLDLGY